MCSVPSILILTNDPLVCTMWELKQRIYIVYKMSVIPFLHVIEISGIFP